MIIARVITVKPMMGLSAMGQGIASVPCNLSMMRVRVAMTDAAKILLNMMFGVLDFCSSELFSYSMIGSFAFVLGFNF